VPVEEHGVPPSIVVAGANAHDATQVENVLRSVVLAPPPKATKHPCADKAYDGQPARETTAHYTDAFLMSAAEVKRPWPSGVGAGARPGGGSWSPCIPGSTASGKSSCATRRLFPVIRPFFTWPRRSSAGERSHLFTDKA
jgi:hypothetical protein